MNAIWHPGATKNQVSSAGSYALSSVPWRAVWHSTEGSSLPGYAGCQPHFTFDPLDGDLWQHVPLDKAALALEHRTGTVHTNHARAIQIELIGFTDADYARRVNADERRIIANWTDDEYARIAGLARWIEANVGVERKASVDFEHPSRLSPEAWIAYSGHLGHVHVPGNVHWDPTGLKIEKVLGAAAIDPCDGAGVLLRRGDGGGRVKTVQRRLNTVRNVRHQRKLAVDGDFGPATERRIRSFQKHHDLAVDGVVGPKTWRALCKAARKKGTPAPVAAARARGGALLHGRKA